MQVDSKLTSQIEPFDSFWEAPHDIEKGYGRFAKFYTRNYFKQMSLKPTDDILVISCGPGYMLSLLKEKRVKNVIGIDADPQKITYAQTRRLNANVANAFDFLENSTEQYDIIFAEQEINHLAKLEILQFLQLCHKRLKAGGMIVVHSLNGANPITGPEALAQNFDHQNTFTEYSLKQVLEHNGFHKIKIFPLQLYIFYENPVNIIGMFIDGILNIIFRVGFIFYGKSNKLFSKKIGAIGWKK